MIAYWTDDELGAAVERCFDLRTELAEREHHARGERELARVRNQARLTGNRLSMLLDEMAVRRQAALDAIEGQQ